MNPPAIVRTASDLGALAKAINADHESGEASQAKSLEHYRAAGEKLLMAKATVDHGNWDRWCKINIRFSKRTAEQYMKVAKNWQKVMANAEEIRSKSAATALLEEELAIQSEKPPEEPITLVSALSLLTKPPEDEKPAPEPLPEYPERVRPYFDEIPLLDSVHKAGTRAVHELQKYEQSVSFLKSTEGKKRTLISTYVKTTLQFIEWLRPVKLCPNGCATVAPSDDSDPCKLCGGKGFQNKEDLE